MLSNISVREIIWQHSHSHGTAIKTFYDVTSKCAVSHCSKNNQTIMGIIFANGEQQHTFKNFTYFNFLDTIFIIHLTRQTIQFYVSHCCKHNLHITPLETNDFIWCIPWMQTRWDPKVCIASCETINKIGLRMTNL